MKVAVLFERSGIVRDAFICRGWQAISCDLEPTDIIRKDRYSNQTPSGQNNLPPSPDRARIRSETYTGIAEAIASQWTKYIEEEIK